MNTQTLPRLKKIDPCEGCYTRSCYNCGFLAEHLRIQDNKVITEIRNDFLKLHAMPQMEHIPHDHGTTWNDCSHCDSEITDGKLVDITIDGRHSIIHICNGCFLKDEFQELVKQDKNVKIRNY